MRRCSLYHLIKKSRNYSHISIFFNNRIDKPIRYGYRYIQKAFREPKRLKFLKINVRQPRLPVRRKTSYGKRLLLRQKCIYAFNFGRLKKLVSYGKIFSQPGRISRFSSFSSLTFFNLFNMVHAFGFSENPSFNFFLGRYFNFYAPIGNISRTFTTQGFHKYAFPKSGYFYFYAIRTFFFRLYIKTLPIFYTKKSFIFNFKTFCFYPYSKTFKFASANKKVYDFKFGQFAFGRLR